MAERLRPVYEGKFTDRFPELSAAGMLLLPGDTAASCLTEVLPRPITPATMWKFQNTTNPAPGVERIFYGRADGPDIAAHLTHAASLINPLPKTDFQQRIQDKKEANYFSIRQVSLGKSHDQFCMLPKGLDIINTTFGTKVIQGIPPGEIINPPKTFEEVDKEAKEDMICTLCHTIIMWVIDNNLKKQNDRFFCDKKHVLAHLEYLCGIPECETLFYRQDWINRIMNK